jgi:HSP20 family protein
VTPNFPTYPFRTQPAVSTTLPAANILRKEGAYVIELAVPGLAKEQIRIEMEQDQLIVSADKTESQNSGKVVRQEFGLEGFKRTFRLHKNANTGAMTATFSQGILTIVIPDKEPETRKIEIQ